MSLPDALALWAGDTYYDGTTDPTRVAASAARVAQGFVPLTSAIAAQELNEYLYRIGAKIAEYRTLLDKAGGLVPGLWGESNLHVPLTPAGGTWSLQEAVDVDLTYPHGILIAGNDEAHWQISTPGPGAGYYLKGAACRYHPDADDSAPVTMPALRLIYGRPSLTESVYSATGGATQQDSGTSGWPDGRLLQVTLPTPYPSANSLTCQLRMRAGSVATAITVASLYLILSETDGT